MSETFQEIAARIGKLTDEKNQAYGSSHSQTGEFFKLLYPDGIKPSQYTAALTLARIFDKCKRIATNETAFGEEPWKDIVGYGLLGAQASTPAKPDVPVFLCYECGQFISESRYCGSGACDLCLDARA